MVYIILNIILVFIRRNYNNRLHQILYGYAKSNAHVKQCIMHVALCNVNCVHCTVYTLYTIHCTSDAHFYIEYSIIYCKLYIVQRTLAFTLMNILRYLFLEYLIIDDLDKRV